MTGKTSDAPLGERIVFVLGHARSGTTWLVQLLAAHPHVAAPDIESAVFIALEDYWRNAHRVDGEGVAAYLDHDRATAACRAFADRIFSEGIRQFRPSATWFVEKTPGHMSDVPLLMAVYPDAWYIHIVRDGRDVARSITKAPFGPDNAGDAIKLWVDRERAFRLNKWRLRRLREVRYEDLVADPLKHGTELLNWLGLPVDDEVIANLEKQAATQVVRFGSTEPVGAGKWQQLDPSERAMMHAVAGDLLAELGYLQEGGSATSP